MAGREGEKHYGVFLLLSALLAFLAVLSLLFSLAPVGYAYHYSRIWKVKLALGSGICLPLVLSLPALGGEGECCLLWVATSSPG
jgi:hypothetical protein